MRISELYGGATEGEGALLGERMPFVRVAGCNLSCSWCDSAYTWRKDYEYTEMSVEQVLAAIDALRGDCRWVSLTGGEPTLYARELEQIVDGLLDREMRAIIETNGLRAVAAFEHRNVFVSCSPKLPGSGQDTPARRAKVRRLVELRNASFAWRMRTQWKFVVATQADLDALVPYCNDVGIETTGDAGSIPVYVQPDGYVQPIEKYLEALAWLQREAPAFARVTPQVHRLVHGPDARGV